MILTRGGLMKTILIAVCLVLVTSMSYAQDYWVYIRTYNRPTVDPIQIAQGTYGRSKKGDIVQMLPVKPEFTPSEYEKTRYCIIRVNDISDKDREKYQSVWNEQIGTDSYGDPINKKKADRQYVLDIDSLNLQVGLYPTAVKFATVKHYLRKKNDNDLIAYLWGYRKYAYIDQPIKKMCDWIIPKAYALTVNTYSCNKTGEDYNTITLWEDDRDGNLTGDDRQETLECYDDDGVLDENASVDINDSTTDATRFMKVTAPVGERHDGTVASGFEMSRSGGVWMRAADDYCEFSWLILTTATGISHDIVIQQEGSSNTKIKNCIGYGVTEGADRGVFKKYNGTGMISVNSLVYSSSGYGFQNHSTYNCSAYDLSDAGFGGGDHWNGLAVGAGLDFTMSAGSEYTTNCMSTADRAVDYMIQRDTGTTDASGNTGTTVKDTDQNFEATVLVGYWFNNDTLSKSSQISVVVDNETLTLEESGVTGNNDAFRIGDSCGYRTAAENFVNPGTDHHLLSTAPAIDAGTDLVDTPTDVKYDIDNYDRDTAGVIWDMGADEYVAAAPSGRGQVIIISLYKQFILALRSILT